MDSQELQRIKDSVYQEGMSELEMKERLYEKLDKILEGKDLYLKMVQLEIDNIKEFDEMYPDDKLWIEKRRPQILMTKKTSVVKVEMMTEVN